MQIRSRFDATKVLFESATATTMLDLVQEAVKANASLDGAALGSVDLSFACLAGASFVDANLSGSNLSDADLTGANFTDADLVYAYSIRARFDGARFDGANLNGMRQGPLFPVTESKTRRARHVQRYRKRHPEVPVVERLDTQILRVLRLPGRALNMGRWHGDWDGGSCETTHCRAGWAIALAGERGHALELKYGPEIAGGMVYRASTGRVPNFHSFNSVAMADIKRCAADET
jgi:Pentapeptide repeats (8 copies)